MRSGFTFSLFGIDFGRKARIIIYASLSSILRLII
jgi:hypothetical protein